jgi:hypothetical protein
MVIIADNPCQNSAQLFSGSFPFSPLVRHLGWALNFHLGSGAIISPSFWFILVQLAKATVAWRFGERTLCGLMAWTADATRLVLMNLVGRTRRTETAACTFHICWHKLLRLKPSLSLCDH